MAKLHTPEIDENIDSEDCVAGREVQGSAFLEDGDTVQVRVQGRVTRPQVPPGPGGDGADGVGGRRA